MSDDTLITEFLEESLESLTALDEKIAALVHSEDLVNDVNQIFRPVHSIKGAASFFKLSGLMSMAHKLETVLDQLRQLKLEVSAKVVDLLNKGFFLLRSLVERGLSGQLDMNKADEALLEELEELLNGGNGQDKEKAMLEILKLLSDVDSEVLLKVEQKLKGVLDIKEVTEHSDNPLQEVVDLVKLQVSDPDTEHIKSIREKCAEQLEILGEAQVSNFIKAFLEDFNALADSPVGVDEMMSEVLLAHLEDARKCYPIHKEAEVSEANAAQEPPKENEEKKSSTATPIPQKGGGSIRVNVNLLEDIMNLMSELVLSRNELNVHAGHIQHPALSKTTQQVSSIMTELQSKVMKTRLQPVSTVFNPLPGVVREISRVLNKEVDLILEGKDTELDRGVLEGIKDPITHLLRNSLDHGFETPEERRASGKGERGRLHIRAFHEGGQVVIEIKDDGRGVNIVKVSSIAVEKGLYSQREIDTMTDNQKAEIIFAPGFSTADKISQVSGRGVGMDVVKSNIVAMGGQVELDSKFGKGTCIRLKIPLTLAIVPTLIVGAAGQRFAIPQVSLEEMVLLKSSEENQIEKVRGVEVYRLRGKILPIVRLNRVLKYEEKDSEEGIHIVVLSSGSKSFGLIVEELFDIEEIVVKSLSDFFVTNKLFSGATILGDGSIALIFDILQISEMVGIGSGPINIEPPVVPFGSIVKLDQVLLFGLENKAVYGIPMGNVERLEQIKSEHIERMNEKWFLRYRGRVLALASAWEILQIPQPEQLPKEVHVVVYSDGMREIGFVVHEIVDVVPMEGEAVGDITEEPYFLGSAIIQKKVITLVNLPFIAQDLLGAVRSPLAKENVLLWESSPEMTKKAMDLREQGYVVTEVHSREEMGEVIRAVEVDVVLTEDQMDDDDRAYLNESLNQKYGQGKKVTVVNLSESEDWQSQLDSEQLSDVLEDILKAQLGS